MSEQATALLERFRSLPRAFQWLGVAVALVVGFIVWDETVGAAANGWNLQAEDILAQVADVRAADELTRTLERSRDVIRSVGPVEVPTDARRGTSDLHDLVNRLLKEHRVDNDTFESGRHGRLRRDALSAVTGPGERVEVIRGELSFEADPETVIKIISELENNPAVEYVSALRMNKEGSKLRVTIQVHSWVIARDSRGRNA